MKVLALRLRNNVGRILAIALLSTAAAALCWRLGWLHMAAAERSASTLIRTRLS